MSAVLLMTVLYVELLFGFTRLALRLIDFQTFFLYVLLSEIFIISISSHTSFY